MKHKENEAEHDPSHENVNEQAAGDDQPINAETQEEQQQDVNPVTTLQKEIADLNDRHLRLFSEFDNYKKRTAREKIEFSKMAGAEIILSLLPVLDDLERAVKSIESTTDINIIKDGVTLIYNKFKNTMSQKGLKEMGSKGNPFDSDLHDAISNVPAPSEDMKGKVVDEIEKGYYLNDKIIRHAKVIVGQ